MLFYKSGPNAGQPRGYAFVTFKNPDDRFNALEKLHGMKVGDKHIVIRAANKINHVSFFS